MDLIKTLSNVLGVICIVIGVFLIPLSIWFLRPAIKNRDRVSLVVAIVVLALAMVCFIGAYFMFTSGLIKMAVM
ncbi:MAG: hypothetical protein PHY03_05730 [Dehalococcoidia bacterium]|nr:hypothetical protein [Dehalococcoidia bacterium]